MTVYYIFDNCPVEFGDPEVKENRGYRSKYLAEFRLKRLKEKHPYENQYLEIRALQLD